MAEATVAPEGAPIKTLRLFLTDEQRGNALNAMLWLTGDKRRAVQPIIDRLLEYGAPEPDDAVKQAVFEDLLDVYGDMSAKEHVRADLDEWAPPDYQAHLDYMAEVAAEDDDAQVG